MLACGSEARCEVKLAFEQSLIGFVRSTEDKEREGRRRYAGLCRKPKRRGNATTISFLLSAARDVDLLRALFDKSLEAID